MSENNCNRFKQYISNCDWQEILTHQDTNIAFESFHMKLKSAYDKVFPKNKITKTCFTGKPWLTEGLKHSIKSHSTYLVLTILMDKITKSLENGDYVIGVFLDFGKAFDTVDHEILLSKLCYYGIRGSELDWFVSYLMNRKQYVTYNNEQSELKHIPCGVPHGSMLGPLLFLIYINDLSNVCKFAMPIFFADDSNLFRNGKNISDIENELNEELSEMVRWLKINKLTLNVDKTQCMLFSNKKCSTNLNIKIEGTTIAQVNKATFPGVMIDDKLKWKDHILYISNKISKGIGVTIKARVLGKNSLLSLYYSLVYPYFTYCCQIWGATYVYNIEILSKLQEKSYPDHLL